MYPPGHYNHPYTNGPFSNTGFAQTQQQHHQQTQWHFNNGFQNPQENSGGFYGNATANAGQNYHFSSGGVPPQYSSNQEPGSNPAANGMQQQWNAGGWNYPGSYGNQQNGTAGPDPTSAYQRTLEYVQQCQTWNTGSPSANPQQ